MAASSVRGVPDSLKRFGLAVRAARRECGWAQEQLSEAAGLDRTYISGLERGQRNPTLTTQCRIATALGRPLSELIKAAEEMQECLLSSAKWRLILSMMKIAVFRICVTHQYAVAKRSLD